MAEATEAMRKFFDEYARATGSLDLAILGTAYADIFMFASPGGVQAVKRDDFLRVVPKRGALFRAAGLAASELRRLDETRLDDEHTMVKVDWSLRFETPAGRSFVEIAATYVLRRQDGAWQIVFQLDHHDLRKRVQELGLMPPSG